MARGISIDAAICSGKPCIAGTRIMVTNILGMLAGGYTIERILDAYPELSREDVIAAIDFATRQVELPPVEVAESNLGVLLDQNVPRALRFVIVALRPRWIVQHTSDVGLSGAPDPEIAAWCGEQRFVLVTFDEDFADRRTGWSSLPAGVIRLRVHPTTLETASEAITRVLASLPDDNLIGSLVVRRRWRDPCASDVRRSVALPYTGSYTSRTSSPENRP